MLLAKNFLMIYVFWMTMFTNWKIRLGDGNEYLGPKY